MFPRVYVLLVGLDCSITLCNLCSLLRSAIIIVVCIIFTIIMQSIYVMFMIIVYCHTGCGMLILSSLQSTAYDQLVLQTRLKLLPSIKMRVWDIKPFWRRLSSFTISSWTSSRVNINNFSNCLSQKIFCIHIFIFQASNLNIYTLSNRNWELYLEGSIICVTLYKNLSVSLAAIHS